MELAKQILIPGSLSFLLIGVIAGALLLWFEPRGAKWGRRWFAFLAGLYLCMSLPPVTGLLEGILRDDSASITRPEAGQDLQAIVILGGGTVTYRASSGEISELGDATSLRVLEGARLYHLLDQPWVIVSGGSEGPDSAPETDPMTQELLDLGVPAARIRAESSSGNTREQAQYLHPVLVELQAQRFVLVTSPIHMRRALAVFRRAGLQPVPSAAAQHPLDHPVERGSLLPSSEALSASQAALRELLALSYYWARGWIREQ